MRDHEQSAESGRNVTSIGSCVRQDITLKRGQTWPVALRASNAIEIVYVAGYANAAAVPAMKKRAVKQLAAFLYSNRGDDCDPADAYHKSGAAGIMDQFRAAKI